MIPYIIAIAFTLFSMISGKYMYMRRATISRKRSENKKDVSIIIPARNEAKNLPKLLNSIAKDPQIEVIVMDDDSTDNTIAIAKYYDAKVYTVNNDMTWKGKSHACWEGSHYATNDLLMFIDADVQFTSDDSIWRIMYQYNLQGNKGLLSIQPFHKIKRLYENCSAIFNLMTIVGMNKFSIHRSLNERQSAFGPLILTNKRDYELTHGHLNAKDKVIEGFALSNAYHNRDLPVDLFEGQGVVNFRMYPQGFRALLEGWGKHFALGSKETKRSTLSLIILWLLGSSISTLSILFSLKLGILYLILAVTIYFMYALQFHKFIRRTGNFNFIASICHPLLFICFIGIFFKSWLDINVFKRVQWKGRNIDL